MPHGAHVSPDMPSTAHSYMLSLVDWCFLCSTSCWHARMKSLCISVWEHKITSAPSGAALLANQHNVNILVSLETMCFLILCWKHAVKSLCSRQSQDLKPCQSWCGCPTSSFTRLDPSRSVCLICTRCCEVTVLWAVIVKSIQRACESQLGCSSECWAEQQKSKAAYTNEMSSLAA